MTFGEYLSIRIAQFIIALLAGVGAYGMSLLVLVGLRWIGLLDLFHFAPGFIGIIPWLGALFGFLLTLGIMLGAHGEP